MNAVVREWIFSGIGCNIDASEKERVSTELWVLKRQLEMDAFAIWQEFRVDIPKQLSLTSSDLPAWTKITINSLQANEWPHSSSWRVSLQIDGVEKIVSFNIFIAFLVGASRKYAIIDKKIKVQQKKLNQLEARDVFKNHSHKTTPDVPDVPEWEVQTRLVRNNVWKRLMWLMTRNT